MTTSLRPPEWRELTPELAIKLRQHLVGEIEADLRQITDSPRSPGLATNRRRLVGALIVAAFAVSIFFGLSPGGELGSAPQVGQSTAKAAIEVAETTDAYEITFVTLAEDATQVEADLKALGLNITIDFVPVSPSLENRLVAMSSPSEGENLPHFVETTDGITPSRLVVPKGFNGQAALTVGRPAEQGEDYVSSAISAQMAGEALECVSIEGKTAGAALPLLESVEANIEWRADSSDETFEGSVPEEYLGWYVIATVPIAPGRVLIFLTDQSPESQGSTSSPGGC